MRISNMIKWIEDKTIAATPKVVNAVHNAAIATANATAPKPKKRKPAAKKVAAKTKRKPAKR